MLWEESSTRFLATAPFLVVCLLLLSEASAAASSPGPFSATPGPPFGGKLAGGRLAGKTVS